MLTWIRERIMNTVLFASLAYFAVVPYTSACAQTPNFTGVDDAEGRRVMEQASRRNGTS